MTDTLLLAVDAGAATLTLNRPAARNALNGAMCADLQAACRTLAADAAVRVVFIRASGPVFCAGADLKERQGMDEDAVRARRLKAFAAYNAIESLPMPSVAVVAGPAVGSGCEIAAACDFIVATPAASFRTPEALWGTVGATQRLPRILGKRLAKDMMFTGRVLRADEALAAGLVARVVAAEELERELASIAATIAKAPPAALALAKACVDRGIEQDPRGALATEILAIEENLARNNWRAGIAGFGKAAS
ncbi:MAG: enoyl-CoA hydratase/isomerase family protein [Burkholderiales bacterium]|nr:enoyl-CoA hydratase/isomerase family protein [Burkholderiales bacterium]